MTILRERREVTLSNKSEQNEMSQKKTLLFSPANSELGVTEFMCDKDRMQYLDALESRGTQGFPEEPITTLHYEILQRFTDGVQDPYRDKNWLWCMQQKVT